MKSCCICKIEKPFFAFPKDKTKKDGYHSKCKSCRSEHEKNIRLLGGREKDKQRLSKWLEQNIERKRQKDREHYSLNRQSRIDYVKNYRKQDVKYGLSHTIRSLINISFRKNGYKKESKTHEILGCDYSFFVSHIEKQFQCGMTWENRGQWHIDHIVPLASAKTKEEIVKLNHFTNLRPLWATENLQKNCKVEFLI